MSCDYKEIAKRTIVRKLLVLYVGPTYEEDIASTIRDE